MKKGSRPYILKSILKLRHCILEKKFYIFLKGSFGVLKQKKICIGIFYLGYVFLGRNPKAAIPKRASVLDTVYSKSNIILLYRSQKIRDSLS